MFVSVYLTCNTGIAGDENVLPSELLESGWPARIRGEILLPCVVEISCISGRLIDCAVCHRSIVNIAKLRSFVEGPWKTHQALLLTLPRSPRSFLTRSLTTSPMKFPDFDRNAKFLLLDRVC